MDKIIPMQNRTADSLWDQISAALEPWHCQGYMANGAGIFTILEQAYKLASLSIKSA